MRSIGSADEVARRTLREPALLAVLIDGMSHHEPLIRMRASDAAEKVSAVRPEWFHPYRDRLLGAIAEIEQQEVRWHVAQILPVSNSTRHDVSEPSLCFWATWRTRARSSSPPPSKRWPTWREKTASWRRKSSP